MMNSDRSEPKCGCTEYSTYPDSPLRPDCACPRDEHDLVIHEETCLLYKNETIMFPHEPEGCECVSPRFEGGICKCCACVPDECRCRKAGREAFDEWRKNRDLAGAMPAVLEPGHPLMQRFQLSLRQFLEKENALAEEEILNLRDELRLSKEAYDKDLQDIYKSDHDTNAQRTLIEEYEANLAKSAAERQQAELRAKEANERYRKTKEKLEQDLITEREATEELEALTMLCRQLEEWRTETESDLTISQTMSDKMRREKRELAEEKRQLDMIIFGLNTEVWKLESKLEMFQKQIEIKNNEMEKVNDKVTSYAAELEDLELDKRRLVSLWNSVLVNIQQRDKVYDSVRDDYRVLQENFRTLISNLDVTKKALMDEMNKGKEISLNKDKIMYELNNATRLFDAEDVKRVNLETQISELTESIEMCERDQDMIKMENQAMLNILKSTQKEFDRKTDAKLKLENEILINLQECLLNDKAVESMANGIKKMREMSRKQEISLTTMENQHAKVMLDIEIYRNNQSRSNQLLEVSLEKVRSREKEIDELEDQSEQNLLLITRKQRELDLINKKYAALKEVFDVKSPQQRRIEELESQIRTLRERTESMQHEWLRLQGHVVKLAAQHQKLVADVNLINKQIQICEQKTMRIQADCENVISERARVDRSLRDLRGRLEVLERTRKDASERNQGAQRSNMAFTHEYTAKLKDAESDIMEIEEQIEDFEKEKENLTQDLDRMQREALIWQRKGIMALELKKNIHGAKSTAGEIGQMRNEIHRMEVRREQLRRIGEKLSDDLAQCVTKRETAMDKNRAAAAVEKAHGTSGQTSQSQYHHKLRLARADVARVTKEIAETRARMEQLQKEQERLEREVSEGIETNARLEEQVAALIRECTETEREKQWLLERVVRAQRLGAELATAVKRQSVKVRKPRPVVVQEYTQSKDLNERLRRITETLIREYPYLEDKLALVLNTLDIHEPDEERLAEQCCFGDDDSVQDQNIAEKPLEY